MSISKRKIDPEKALLARIEPQESDEIGLSCSVTTSKDKQFSFVATALNVNNLYIYDANKKFELVATLAGGERYLRGIQFSYDDGSLLAWANSAGKTTIIRTPAARFKEDKKKSAKEIFKAAHKARIEFSLVSYINCLDFFHHFPSSSSSSSSAGNNINIQNRHRLVSADSMSSLAVYEIKIDPENNKMEGSCLVKRSVRGAIESIRTSADSRFPFHFLGSNSIPGQAQMYFFHHDEKSEGEGVIEPVKCGAVSPIESLAACGWSSQHAIVIGNICSTRAQLEDTLLHHKTDVFQMPASAKGLFDKLPKQEGEEKEEVNKMSGVGNYPLMLFRPSSSSSSTSSSPVFELQTDLILNRTRESGCQNVSAAKGLIATAINGLSQEFGVAVYNEKTGEEIFRAHHKQQNWCCAFEPNGKFLASFDGGKLVIYKINAADFLWEERKILCLLREKKTKSEKLKDCFEIYNIWQQCCFFVA